MLGLTGWAILEEGGISHLFISAAMVVGTSGVP
jgi:hypothetical protein